MHLVTKHYGDGFIVTYFPHKLKFPAPVLCNRAAYVPLERKIIHLPRLVIGHYANIVTESEEIMTRNCIRYEERR
jgi:hypothetical protein